MKAQVFLLLVFAVHQFEAKLNHYSYLMRSLNPTEKEELLKELEAIVNKHRDKPMLNVDIEKLKLLREKIDEVLDLLDDIYKEAAGGNATTPTGPSGKVPNCAVAYKSGHNVSGVYKIHVPGLVPTAGLPVYCDMDIGRGGWTVVQRRFNGSVDFYRKWDDYKSGFGDPHGEYWLGLDALHHLTKDKNQELYVLLEEFDGSMSYARYGLFNIGPASSNYKLVVGTFSGSAGDGLKYHNNMGFSTLDRDNDKSSRNCAEYWCGAWWYKDCTLSNLNSKYRKSPSGKHNCGIIWPPPNNKNANLLKATTMMIRPICY